MPKSSDSVTGLLSAANAESDGERSHRGTLEAQLRDLYDQRQELQRALGTADSGQIIAMVRSLEAQLADLYGLLRGQRAHLPDNTD